MATDSGYNNQKKKGIAQFETVQGLGSSKYGKSVANKALFDRLNTSIASITDVLGRDGQIAFWEIGVATNHNAEIGDILKVDSFEFEIAEIVNPTTVRILPLTDVKPVAFQSVIVKSWVTSKASADGSSSVAFISAPALYKYDGADQVVIQDTANAANNRALPAVQFIIKDGVQVPIRKDTVTPANTVGIPVELVAASGTPINITAGDLNVSTNCTNDSMAIGDSVTGNKVEVINNSTSTQSLSVIDEDNIIQTTAIKNSVQSIDNKQTTANSSLSSIDGKVGTSNTLLTSIDGKQTTINSAVVSIDSKTPTLGQKAMAASQPVVIASDQSAIPVTGSFSISGGATEAKQDTQITQLGSVTETAPATDTASSGLNGRLQRIAQRLTSLIGLLPISLGQKPMADSLAVTLASDQSTLPVSQTAGVLDPTNSSTTPLGIGGVFTGAAFDITGYVAINVNLKSDVPSATNGVTVQVSPDGINWDHAHSTTYTAATGVGYIFYAEFRYARVVYTNGATAQSYFRLQTIFKNTLTKSSLYTLSQGINSNMFAELGRSVITGETTAGGGGYVNVKVNPSGALVTDSTVSGSVSVSNFPATQAVTGTFWQATQPVSAAALPLPSGASTLAEQQTQSVYLSSIDGQTLATSLPVHTETSAFNTSSFVVSGIDPTGSTVRALRVNSSNQLLTFIGNSSIATEQSSQAGIITQTQKSVGLTAVRATVSGSAPLSSRKKLMLKPSKNNTGSIYFGASTVTTASGMEIIGPDRLEFEFDSSDYYLISDTAGQVVEVVEVV